MIMVLKSKERNERKGKRKLKEVNMGMGIYMGGDSLGDFIVNLNLNLVNLIPPTPRIHPIHRRLLNDLPV